MRLGRASAYGMLAMISIARESIDATAKIAKRKHADGSSNGQRKSQRTVVTLAPAQQISDATGVPIEYLRKVLQRLARARLVVSERGRGGGFRLARPAHRITLLHIVEAIEGPIDEAAFLGQGVLKRPLHPRLNAWRRHAAGEIRQQLDSESLADLAK